MNALNSSIAVYLFMQGLVGLSGKPGAKVKWALKLSLIPVTPH